MAVDTVNSPIEFSEELFPEWSEALFGVELAILHSSPVYYGLGVPHGDGDAVLLFPGFTHGDGYLFLLNAWLRRIGYKPHYSGIGLNANCPNLLIKDIVDHVIDQVIRETHRKIHLIGHSLGGAIARSVAVQRPNDIASVITLGTPVRRTLVHRSSFRDAEAVRNYVVEHSDRVKPECMTTLCDCEFMRSMKRPVPRKVNYTAIYTRNDGSVNWQSCTTGDPRIDVEVPGTHTGLTFNPTVYNVIAQRLATKRRAENPALSVSV